MRSFDLISIDWDSVRLLQAGQFKQETFYLEELVRWILQRGRIHGLLHLADGGVSPPSPAGEQMFSVSVHGCIAVAEDGGMIEIPDDPGLALRGTIEARYTTVPLYIGVSRLERSAEPEIYPSIDTGLLQCGGLRRQYHLSADDSDTAVDWFQVAQFERTPTGLHPDPGFLPECLFLSSHDGLWGAQDEIKSLANQALDALEKHSTNAVPVYAVAAALAGSLGPAARLVDARLHPRAYVDRLAGVLAAQRSQLRTIPSQNLSVYQEALEQLDATLKYLEPETEWALGEALRRAAECFRRLLRLYPDLLKSLNVMPAERPQERGDAGHEIAIPAHRPGQPSASPPYAPRSPRPAASGQEETPPAPPPRRGGGSLWRK